MLLEINSRSSEEIWIPNLNLGFTEMQFLTNNKQICDAILNAAMLLICKETPTLNIQSTTLPASMFTFSPVKTIHIHHNGKGHFIISSSLTNKVKIYDCMNIKPTTELLEQIIAIYSCDSTIPEILHVYIYIYIYIYNSKTTYPSKSKLGKVSKQKLEKINKITVTTSECKSMEKLYKYYKMVHYIRK